MECNNLRLEVGAVTHGINYILLSSFRSPAAVHGYLLQVLRQ